MLGATSLALTSTPLSTTHKNRFSIFFVCLFEYFSVNLLCNILTRRCERWWWAGDVNGRLVMRTLNALFFTLHGCLINDARWSYAHTHTHIHSAHKQIKIQTQNTTIETLINKTNRHTHTHKHSYNIDQLELKLL